MESTTGTPLGTGDVYVNPNGNLSVAAPTSLSNSVTVFSDRAGLGGFGVQYDTTTLPGNVEYVTTGPFDGALNLDSRFFSAALDLSALGPNGRLFLGSAADGIYAAPTLTAGTGNAYRLGAGGSTLNFQWYEGQLAGANDLHVGAVSNTTQAASINLSNGGSITLDNRNPLLSGDVYLNNNTLTARVGGALGTGDLIFNGGTLAQASQILIVRNDVRFLGDAGMTNDMTFTGNVDLLPATGAAGGATRIINANNNTAINGVVSGVDANIVKGGAGQLVLNGANTFNGLVTVSNGTLVVTSDVRPNENGSLGNSFSALLLGDPGSGVNSPTLQLAGRLEFARGITMVAGGTGLRTVRNQSLRRAQITGNIAVAQQSVFESQAGGRLEILGSINGVNQTIQFGTLATTGANGQVRLAAVINGYNISDYTGTTLINDARVIVAGKTLYTGPSDNPTILSGPFGASTVLFNGTTTNSAVSSGISAEGEDIEIVNPIGFGSTTSDIAFRGLNSIRFTRNLNLLTTTVAATREINVLVDPERGKQIEFSGVVSDGAGAAGNIIKRGPGTLVLSGTNTYRGGTQVNEGTLAVAGDASLGATTGAVTLNGGILRFLNSTTLAAARPLSVSSGTFTSAVQVDSGATVLFAGNLGVVGTAAIPTLVKLGPGTLRLDGTNHAIGSLVIGGVNPLSGLIDGVGGGSGTVEVGASQGPVLVNTSNTNASVVINGGTLFVSGALTGTADVTVPRLLIGQSTTQFGSSTLRLAAGTALTLTNVTSTAFVRNGQGTLTLQPASPAGLGVTERFILPAGMSGRPITTTADGMLALPFVVARTNENDATFVTLDGSNSFVLNTAVTAADLNVAPATALGDASLLAFSRKELRALIRTDPYEAIKIVEAIIAVLGRVSEELERRNPGAPRED